VTIPERRWSVRKKAADILGTADPDDPEGAVARLRELVAERDAAQVALAEMRIAEG
jgi:hypothetical protein